MDKFFTDYFELIHQSIQSVNHALQKDAASRIKIVSSGGWKIILAGNGGKAEMASMFPLISPKLLESGPSTLMKQICSLVFPMTTAMNGYLKKPLDSMAMKAIC